MAHIITTAKQAAAQREAQAQATASQREQPRARKAKTVAEPTKLDDTHAAPEDTSSIFERFAQAQDDLMAMLGVASPKRYLVSAVLALLAACGLGMLFGKVIGILMVAALVTTGSMFLMYAILVIGLIISAIATYKLSGLVFEYVVTKKVDAHWAKAKSSVASLFSFGGRDAELAND